MNHTEFAFDSRLDTELLYELYEGDKEHASIVFEQFLGTIHLRLQDIEDDFNSGNIEMFRQKVHKLKPVFSFVGLPSLTDQAELIESQCKSSPAKDLIENSYNDFKTDIEKFIPVIQNEFLKLKD